jgi:2-aminoadipate transaminase
MSKWNEYFANRTTALDGAALSSILRLSGPTGMVNLSGGFPDPSTFRIDLLSELSRTALVDEGPISLQYSPTEGLPMLRDILVDRQHAEVSASGLGAQVLPEELLITSGGIDGLELVVKSFINPGDLVICEAPTYLGALSSFYGFEAQVLAIEIDDEGLSVERLEMELRGGARPKILYVIPDHQNPTSASLSVERRHSLVELARHYHFLIVEDVAYRELSFSGETVPSLYDLAPETVLQLGTFSKTFSPGFRLGWAFGPQEIISQMAIAKQNSDQCAGSLGQVLLAHFFASGAYEPRQVEARALYQHRASVMLDALEQHMKVKATWTRPKGGFFIWLTLPPTISTSTLLEASLAAGIAYVPGKPFYPDERGDNELRLSFSRASDEEISQGIQRLADVCAKAVLSQ